MIEEELDKQLEKLLAGQPTFWFYPRLAHVCGRSPKAALFLSWLIGCLEQTANHSVWIYKTQQDCFDEVGLTRKEQEAARRKLRLAGLLKEKRTAWPARLCFQIQWRRLRLLSRQQSAWGASGWWDHRPEHSRTP